MKHTTNTSDEVALEKQDIIEILKASGVKVDASLKDVTLSWLDGVHRRTIGGNIIVTWRTSKHSDKSAVSKKFTKR